MVAATFRLRRLKPAATTIVGHYTYTLTLSPQGRGKKEEMELG